VPRLEFLFALVSKEKLPPSTPGPLPTSSCHARSSFGEHHPTFRHTRSFSFCSLPQRIPFFASRPVLYLIPFNSRYGPDLYGATDRFRRVFFSFFETASLQWCRARATVVASCANFLQGLLFRQLSVPQTLFLRSSPFCCF